MICCFIDYLMMTTKRKVYIVFMLVYCMGIGDYVNNVRGKVNDSVGKLGGLGRILTKDVSMKNVGSALKTGAFYVAAGAVAAGAFGAYNPGVAEAQSPRQARNVERGWGIVVNSIDNAEESYNEAVREQEAREAAQRTQVPESKLIVVACDDKNGDGDIDSSEVHDIDSSVDLREEGVCAYLSDAKRKGDALYTFSDEKGNVLLKTNDPLLWLEKNKNIPAGFNVFHEIGAERNGKTYSSWVNLKDSNLIEK